MTRCLSDLAVRSFIEATRDAGSKSSGAAIAALVDNWLEATSSSMCGSMRSSSRHKRTDCGGTDDGTGEIANVEITGPSPAPLLARWRMAAIRDRRERRLFPTCGESEPCVAKQAGR
jgi:hypothetical protein